MKPMATATCFVLVRRWMLLPDELECDEVVVQPAVVRLPLRGLSCLIVIFCGLIFSPLLKFAWANTESAPVVDDRQETPPRDVDPGMVYREGLRLRIPGTDWSFVVPDRWQTSRPEDSEMPFLMALEGKGLGMIFPLTDATREEIHDQLSQPLSLLHGLSFIPTGSIVETDTSIARSYQDEDMIGRALATFGPENRCVIYFIMGPREEVSTFEAVLEQLRASTRFTDPVPNRKTGM